MAIARSWRLRHPASGFLVYYCLHGNALQPPARDTRAGQAHGFYRSGGKPAEHAGAEPGNKQGALVGSVFLRMPDLEILARHYGIMLRINYKQNLAEYLRDFLRPGRECFN